MAYENDARPAMNIGDREYGGTRTGRLSGNSDRPQLRERLSKIDDRLQGACSNLDEIVCRVTGGKTEQPAVPDAPKPQFDAHELVSRLENSLCYLESLLGKAQNAI